MAWMTKRELEAAGMTGSKAMDGVTHITELPARHG